MAAITITSTVTITRRTAERIARALASALLTIGTTGLAARDSGPNPKKGSKTTNTLFVTFQERSPRYPDKDCKP
ncbi:MAG: hypothetical protein V4750_00485 [Pseudomonadota bacterium]